MGFTKAVKYTTLIASGKFVLHEVYSDWTDESAKARKRQIHCG